MKLTFKVLAVAVLSSVASVSTWAQAPAVNNGSCASRAPLPSNRPVDFVRVIRLSENAAVPAQSALIATHIAGPVSNQTIPAIAPRQQAVAVIVSTAPNQQ